MDRQAAQRLLAQNPFLSNTDLAFRLLEEALLSGRLALQPGMSRSPAREALRRLEEEGYVAPTPPRLLVPGLDGPRDAVDREDRGRFQPLDSEFHRLLFQSARNRHLGRAGRQILRELRFYLVRLGPEQFITLSLERHRQIYESISARDEAAMKEHMSDAMRTALRVRSAQPV